MNPSSANDWSTSDTTILINQALSNSDEWIMLESLDGKIKYIFGAFQSITGYAPGDFLSGKSAFKDLIEKQDLSAYEDQVKQFRDSEKTYRLNFRIVTNTGRKKRIIQFAEKFFTGEGKLAGWLTINRDDSYSQNLLMQEIGDRMELDILVGEVVFDDAGSPEDWEIILQNSMELTTDNQSMEYSGKQVLDTLLESDRKWSDILIKVALTGETFKYEYYDQSISKHFELSCFQPEQDKFAVILSDITNIKNLHNRLNKVEKLHKAIVETQHELICRSKPDTTLIYANPAYCKMFNQKLEDLIGTKFLKFLPEDAKETLKGHIKSFDQDDKYKKVVHQIILPDQSLAWYEWTNTPVFSESGSLSEIQSVGYDITEQYKTELKLLNIIKRFNVISEHSKTVYWEVDENGKYNYVSDGCWNIYGYSPEELIGRKHFYDLHPEEDRKDFIKRAFEVFKDQGKFENFMGRVHTKQGEIKWISTSGLPMYDGKGIFRGYRGSDTDISLRKKQQDIIADNMRQINDYQEKLKNLNLAIAESEENVKKDVARFLHDDIGQVLSAMHIQLSFLESTPDETEKEHIIKSIKNQLNQGIIQCREMTYELSPPVLKKYGINEAIRGKLSEIEESFNLKTTFSTNFERLEINEKFKLLLYRIVTELINNAIKHAKATKLTVELMVNKNDLQFAVIDDGQGFNYDYKKALHSKKSFGLFSIQESLSAIGGRLQLGKNLKSGTKAIVNIPDFSKI